MDKFADLLRNTPGVSALITLNTKTSFNCDACTLFTVAKTRIHNSVSTIVKCVRRFCFRSTTVVLALVAIKGVLRSRTGKGAASTLGDLVQLTPGATAMIQSKGRIAISVARIQRKSAFIIHPNRGVPISKVILRKDDTIGRTTLAKRDVPMSGRGNSSIDTTAAGRSKFLHYRTAHINRSAALSRVVGVMSSTTTAGTPVTGVTSGMSNVFMPAIVAVTMVAVVM